MKEITCFSQLLRGKCKEKKRVLQRKEKCHVQPQLNDIGYFLLFPFWAASLMQMLSVLPKRPTFRHTAEFNYQLKRRADLISAPAKAADDHTLFLTPYESVFSIFKSLCNVPSTWLISSAAPNLTAVPFCI